MTLESEHAVFGERPVPRGGSRPGGAGAGATTAARPEPAALRGASPLRIPRRVRLVGLPLVLLRASAVTGAVPHEVSPFFVAALIALCRAIVYLSFAAAVVMAIVGLARAVVGQPHAASDRHGHLTREAGRYAETGSATPFRRASSWTGGRR